MRSTKVPSNWIHREDARLDVGPFVSGAAETKILLEDLPSSKTRLKDLTVGPEGGIFNGPHFSRTYVSDGEYGVPFIGSTDMMKADLSQLPLLREKDARSDKLNHLRLSDKTTLISCSGTIGRMVYVRPDMEGTWSSQHIMKVVPDQDRISPGYLFAYLRSRFGLPLVLTNTYGSIVEHIEPEHIEDLPVPRLDGKVEKRIHDKVEEAASKRVVATRKQKKAGERLQEEIGIEELDPVVADKPFHTGSIESNTLDGKLTALYHSDYHRTVLDRLRTIETLQVQEVATSIVEPPRFKRIKIDNPKYGVPFFGTAAIMRIEPDFDYYLPKRWESIEDYLVDENTVLIPRSGQLGGVIGEAVLPYGKVVDGAVSEDAIRVNCETDVDAGYLYVTLSSEVGRRQMKARAFGSSIPHLNVEEIGKVLIPDLPDSLYEEIGSLGFEVARLRDQAIDLENEAIRDVESTIERMNNGKS